MKNASVGLDDVTGGGGPLWLQVRSLVLMGCRGLASDYLETGGGVLLDEVTEVRGAVLYSK